MLRHLALFLFSLCLTLPAAAVPLCHAAAQQTAAPMMATHGGMDHHAMPHSSDGKGQPAAPRRHDCIGCAARFALPQLIAPAPLAPLAQSLAPLRRLDGIATTPALPPPRT